MKKLKEKDMKDETKETQEEELRQTIYTSVILQTHALMRTHAQTHTHRHTHRHTQTHTHRHTHRHTHTPARRGARCCDNLGIQRNQREANAKHKANIEIVGD